jgi:hypothetical protein
MKGCLAEYMSRGFLPNGSSGSDPLIMPTRFFQI